MRIAAIIILLFLTILGVKDMIDTYTNQKKNIESLIEEDNIAKKVKIPNGLEKEYQAILAGESPFFVKPTINGAPSDMSTTPVVDTKVSKSSTQKTLPEDLKQQHSSLKSKIRNYFIKDDNLFVDLLIYNNNKVDLSGKVSIKCSFFDINNKESDLFYWSTDISIQSKKTVLLKEINFGYAILNENKNIWCYVEKLI